MNKTISVCVFALFGVFLGCTQVAEPAPTQSVSPVATTSPEVTMEKQAQFADAVAELRKKYPDDPAGNAAFEEARRELKSKMLGGL